MRYQLCHIQKGHNNSTHVENRLYYNTEAIRWNGIFYIVDTPGGTSVPALSLSSSILYVVAINRNY